jgi:hypothetical protein
VEVDMIDDPGACHSSEVPAKVVALWGVELRKRADALAGEAVDLEHLTFEELREVADVPVRSHHQVAGCVWVPVDEHERVLPAVDDETFFVVAFGGAAKDAPFLLIGAGDVLEPPRCPELLHDLGEVRAPRRRGTLVTDASTP